MGTIKDITGQRFGKLTVIEKTDKRYNRQIIWRCQCDCGNIVELPGGSLRTGHTQSCGCLSHAKKGEDLTGQRFGKLVVIERNSTKQNSSRNIFWNCQCDCGNIRVVSGSDLRTGKVFQCQNCNLANRKPVSSHRGPVKNLVGKKFGKLAVIAEEEKRSKAGRVIWTCQCDCGNICSVESNRLTTYNTTSCGCLKGSTGELEIEGILQLCNIKYKKQFSFEDCLSPKKYKLQFDFAIFDNNNQLMQLIEFDGKQHYEPVDYFGGEETFQYNQLCDNIKTAYCQERNIKLVRIPYVKKGKITKYDLQL